MSRLLKKILLTSYLIQLCFAAQHCITYMLHDARLVDYSFIWDEACALSIFFPPDCDLQFFPYHHKQFNHPEPLAWKRKISEISGLRILEEAYNINIISCDNNVWQKASISAYWVKGCGSSIKCLLISERSKHPLKSIRIHMSSTSFIDEVKTVWAYFWARTYLLVY